MPHNGYGKSQMKMTTLQRETIVNKHADLWADSEGAWNQNYCFSVVDIIKAMQMLLKHMQYIM